MTRALPAGFEAMAPWGALVDTVGPFYQKRLDGGWRFGMLAEARHGDGAGVVHAGVLLTFLEHILGKLVRDALEGEIAAAVSLNADLLATAKPGDWIEAQGEITLKTSSLVFARGRAFVRTKTLATASGIWKFEKRE